MLRPDLLADGSEPEERVVILGLSWSRYLALDKALGDDRPGPCFYYLDGDLEIMSTSGEHERIKKYLARIFHTGAACLANLLTWKGFLKTRNIDKDIPRFSSVLPIQDITRSRRPQCEISGLADLLAIYFCHQRIHIVPRGQATMRLAERAGAEPDESWCLGESKTFPDIVLETALTSGGIPKLDVYRRFAVPEVWFRRRGQLEIHVLRAGSSGYDRLGRSRLLPGLDFALLARCAGISGWWEACDTFRNGLAH